MAGAMAIFSSCALGQTAPTDSMPAGNPGSVVARFPSGTIGSIEMADTALADAARERSEIEARFSREEQACHPQFFATSCIDQAKERRRRALLQLRAVEIEANTFKRQARVVSRDEALANKRKGAEADRLERARQEEESRRAAKAETAYDMQDETKSEAARREQKDIFSDRAASHEARLKREQEKEAASAAKRAENIAAYEKKVRAAQARQAEIAAKKAEKEQRRRAKQASTPAAP